MVGVAAFLASVWRGRLDDAPSSCAAAAAAAAAVAASCAPRERPRERPRNPCLTLTLPAHLFAWVSCMAAEHNLGSVHKSVRDLLAWAAESQQEDLDWMFGRKHVLQPQQVRRQLEQKGLIGADTLGDVEIGVPVQARLSPTLQRWIDRCVVAYKLDGPSHVLNAVCRCAIELDAAEDIFCAAGHDLPRCTADLYYDLGIKGFSSSSPLPCITPPLTPEPVVADGKGWAK